LNLTPLIAQEGTSLDSLIKLPQIEVKEHRLNNYAVGQQINHIDHHSLRTYPMQNLAEVLTEQSAIYLKNYGPGRLNTTSIRGASSSQTAIVWNGIPLIQPMLGQFDLSLFPSFFMDRWGK